MSLMRWRSSAPAVAGLATIDRISPVAFGLIYALSGAVGPILAQNMGAGRVDRVRQTLARQPGLRAAGGGARPGSLLALGQGCDRACVLGPGRDRRAGAAVLLWLAGSFAVPGALFVANAAFNNLGHPLLSTLFNWGRRRWGRFPSWHSARIRGGGRADRAGGRVGGVRQPAVVVAFRVLPRRRARCRRPRWPSRGAPGRRRWRRWRRVRCGGGRAAAATVDRGALHCCRSLPDCPVCSAAMPLPSRGGCGRATKPYSPRHPVVSNEVAAYAPKLFQSGPQP